MCELSSLVFKKIYSGSLLRRDKLDRTGLSSQVPFKQVPNKNASKSLSCRGLGLCLASEKKLAGLLIQ